MLGFAMRYRSCCSWITHFLTYMGNCIGCCFELMDEAKGPLIHGNAIKKTSLSDDFWSTSTYDLDNSMMQSQRSLSSIIISNQSLNHLTSIESSINNPEFINHGLKLWNQSRLSWVGTKKSQRERKAHETVLSWNETYEGLLGGSKKFPQPIPLSELVEFLVDIWEQDGLYD